MVISYLAGLAGIEDGKKTFNQLLFLMLFLGFCILNFYQLRIVVNQDSICIIYGIGLIRIKISPYSLQYVKSVKIPWYAGWGIRFMFSGVLYNIQGREAVKMAYEKGGKSKVAFLGTSYVNGLKRSIETAFADKGESVE